MIRWLVLLIAAVAAVFAAVQILALLGSGAQPWSSELSDDAALGRAAPFALGLGIALGMLRGRGAQQRRADGAVRRFSPWTIAMHWILALGFLLAMPSGMWQYLGGILDAPLPFPIPLYWIYRIHYAGALVILTCVAAFAAAWWMTGERALAIPRGAWGSHLRGLADELGRPAGIALARVLRIDMRRRPPQAGTFSFYEKVAEFPVWTFAIALITVTGLVKAMRYVYPVPGPLLYWSSTLHVAAMVLIFIKTLDHIRYSFANWPLMVAIVTGWLPGSRPAETPSPAPAPTAAATGGEE